MVISATVILVLFLAVNLRRHVGSTQQGHFWLRWPALFLLLVPLLYFIPAQKGRVDAKTLEKRGIQTESGFIPGNLTAEPAASNDTPPPLPEPTDIPLTKLSMNPEEYQGQEVEIVCKTFIDARLPDDLFMCYRYLLTCCAADAMPIFLFIKHPQARSIKNDAWIRATGKFSPIENAKIQVPSIQTDTVFYIDEPPFPFLF